ncbi:uncharacterized protein LOC127080948 [Lathyrus oleraceus]|uniref:uncharacterized protein LOC127080948 n=1 Tax=Pisum sativum TaxID=3888 RepID=UPI0021CE0223|nr:uncharacterized protein LOC127080948 [Pisum sativum]
MDGGRNDQEIANALEATTHLMAQANVALQENRNQNDGVDEFHGLGKFLRNNPPTFKGRYDPKGTRAWHQEIEKIFRVMACTDAQKVLFGTYMLSEEVEYWWKNTLQRMEIANAKITWANFRNEFMDKYFPVDVYSRKEMVVLELKKGNMIVADYAAKFEELSIF